MSAYLTDSATPLQRIRRARNLSQEDLALAAGVDVKSVRMVERGYRPRSSSETSSLGKIARSLHVEASELVLPSKHKPKPLELLAGLRAGSAGRLVHNPQTHPVGDLRAGFVHADARSSWLPVVRTNGIIVLVSLSSFCLQVETFSPQARDQRSLRRPEPNEVSSQIGQAGVDRHLQGELVSVSEAAQNRGLPILGVVDVEAVPNEHAGHIALEALAAKTGAGFVLLHPDERWSEAPTIAPDWAVPDFPEPKANGKPKPRAHEEILRDQAEARGSRATKIYPRETVA